jgi:hypothetical protein
MSPKIMSIAKLKKNKAISLKTVGPLLVAISKETF